MLWILISLFFCLCAFREIRGSFVAPRGYDFPQPVSKTYLAIVLGLAVSPPVTPIREPVKSASKSRGAVP